MSNYLEERVEVLSDAVFALEGGDRDELNTALRRIEREDAYLYLRAAEGLFGIEARRMFAARRTSISRKELNALIAELDATAARVADPAPGLFEKLLRRALGEDVNLEGFTILDVLVYSLAGSAAMRPTDPFLDMWLRSLTEGEQI